MTYFDSSPGSDSDYDLDTCSEDGCVFLCYGEVRVPKQGDWFVSRYIEDGVPSILRLKPGRMGPTSERLIMHRVPTGSESKRDFHPCALISRHDADDLRAARRDVAVALTRLRATDPQYHPGTGAWSAVIDLLDAARRLLARAVDLSPAPSSKKEEDPILVDLLSAQEYFKNHVAGWGFTMKSVLASAIERRKQELLENE